MADTTPALPAVDQRTAYDRFVEEQGVPIVESFHIPDLLEVEVGPWERKGTAGAILRLQGAEYVNSSYLLEIPPSGQTTVQRHMYEELIYVIKGRGATTVWNGRGARTTFEWSVGSFFAIPLNCSYQHFNGSGTEAARYYAVTSAPLMMNLVHNQDFIFNLDYDFTDRFGGTDLNTDFSGSGTAYQARIWETNFVPDVNKMQLQEWKERGAGGSNVMLEIADSSMCGHISQFPVGTYKKAHRHAAGAHVVILSGQGFSLLWREGDPIRRVDWGPGSVVVPGDRWFHQHFNTGPVPARYLAMRWGSQKYRVLGNYEVAKSTREGGDQIEYEDEDPQVRAMFEEDLARNGVQSKMTDITGIPARS